MIIADTGFFFALANPCDRYHQTAVRALQALKSPLITTYSLDVQVFEESAAIPHSKFKT
jgi:predicted nucleic acid-binding protein